jgi:hypothetical protein
MHEALEEARLNRQAAEKHYAEAERLRQVRSRSSSLVGEGEAEPALVVAEVVGAVGGDGRTVTSRVELRDPTCGEYWQHRSAMSAASIGNALFIGAGADADSPRDTTREMRLALVCGVHPNGDNHPWIVVGRRKEDGMPVRVVRRPSPPPDDPIFERWTVFIPAPRSSTVRSADEEAHGPVGRVSGTKGRRRRSTRKRKANKG